MSTPDGRSDNERNTELLNFELPDVRFQDAAYLQWLYDENPLGAGVQSAVDEDDGVRVAHYALIPQDWRNADGPQPLLFSLNAVTHRRSHRSGYFTKLGEENFDKARQRGRKGIIGVPNDKSTPAAVKYLGYTFLQQMPVRLVFPRPARGTESWWVDEAFLASDRFAEVAQGLDEHPAASWTCRYGPEYLRWRLAQPHARYALHVTRDLVAVSTRSDYRGAPIAVLLKLLPRTGADTSRPLSGAPAVAAACRHHRTPVALYSGFNAHVHLPGVPLPKRIRPVPLNLVYKSLSDDIPADSFTLDTYEFLDMDAF